MTRPRKYDHDKIINDYVSGLSLNQLREKYGICISHSSKILREKGLMRSPSEASLLMAHGKITEWRKLTKVHTKLKRGRKVPCTTHLVSIAGSYLKQLGLDPHKNFVGKWIVQDENNGLFLQIKEA